MSKAADFPPELDYLVQAFTSFGFAQFGLKFLLEYPVDEDNQQEGENTHKLLFYRHIEDSVITSYCKPFKKSYGGMKNMKPDDELLKYNEKQIQIHNKIMCRRDKIIAHSDVEMQRISIRRIEFAPGLFSPQISYDLGPSLGREELIDFMDLIIRAKSSCFLAIQTNSFSRENFHFSRGINLGDMEQ
ncbi:MAG: hypothetical protein ABF623_09575 [Gluconobacter cerinus]|uniref:hypothetical protein n=1 Tax=Gluconobacter cerinus TaxID=38307 RepID=UPI0039E7AA18